MINLCLNAFISRHHIFQNLVYGSLLPNENNLHDFFEILIGHLVGVMEKNPHQNDEFYLQYFTDNNFGTLITGFRLL